MRQSFFPGFPDGVDRVPEVRTLRDKITLMARTGNPGAWMKELAKTWMEGDPEEAGYLYIDGHVRVYHGEKAHLPRRYVSRERLCLRGTTDYWINDALGRPFFVVSKATTDGLAATLLKDITPQLLSAVPHQPSAEELLANPRRHRFILVFDREGATGSLLGALWEQRIGAITYRKNVKDLWPTEEFIPTEVAMPDGARTTMQLALRETGVSDNSALRVKEVRRLTDSGHQTAIISTAHELDAVMIAGRMFSRWCQENFFAYMMQHYDIDGLLQYGAEQIPGTERIINPAWRALNTAVATTRHRLHKLQARLGARAAVMDGATIQRDAEQLQVIQAVEGELAEIKAQRKATARKVTLDALPRDSTGSSYALHSSGGCSSFPLQHITSRQVLHFTFEAAVPIPSVAGSRNLNLHGHLQSIRKPHRACGISFGRCRAHGVRQPQ